jgi:septum formation protein
MHFSPQLQLVLASQSPRRLEILRTAGFEPLVRPPQIPEIPVPGESPAAYVERLAREKALATPCSPGEVVLAADTIVVCENRILEKPRDASHAAEMLQALSGRPHQVFTGVHMVAFDNSYNSVEDSKVHFAPLTEEEIRWYASTGEGLDKAGAYAIQGLGSRFIRGIEGCYWNVVGLPIHSVYRLFREAGCLTA